jgi:hypothetical protein
VCVYGVDEYLFRDDAVNYHSETTFVRHCSYNASIFIYG